MMPKGGEASKERFGGDLFQGLKKGYSVGSTLQLWDG